MKLKQIAENKRTIPLILFAVSAICVAVLLILYLAAGTNKLSPDLLPEVIVGAVLTLAVGLAIVIVAAVAGKMAALSGFIMYALGLFTFIEYIASQLNYISNVFYGVDGNSFTAPIVLSLVFGLATFVSALAGAIICFRREKNESRKEKASSGKFDKGAV